MEGKRVNAYLTVYLTLCLTVTLSLFLLLIESAARNGAVLEASCIADVGMQSVMAEYHRELLEQYNLFAIDASYGTDYCGKINTEFRLGKYLEENAGAVGSRLFEFSVGGAEVTGVSLLTDGGGEVFRQRAVEAIRDDVGLELLEQLRDWVTTVEINGLESAEPEKEMDSLDREIEEYETESTSGATEKLENPVGKLSEMRRQGILKLVLEPEESVSYRIINPEELAGGRCSRGEVSNGNLHVPLEETLLDKFLFREYLIRYCGHYKEEKEQGALGYQQEYLIVGKEGDADNLRGIAERLCALREAANAIYLFSDVEKSGEVEALAATICTALLVPELTPVLKSAIILGWAYAESVYDVKKLFAGEKIPLIKDDSSWYLGLDKALQGEVDSGKKEEKGLCYEDYMRIFMFLTGTDKLTERAMNLVEADVRETAGNERFRLDGCYDRIQAKINITSGYGYKFELIRVKSY